MSSTGSSQICWRCNTQEHPLSGQELHLCEQHKNGNHATEQQENAGQLVRASVFQTDTLMDTHSNTQNLLDIFREIANSFKLMNKILKKSLENINKKEDDLVDMYRKLLVTRLRQLPKEEAREMMHEIDGVLLKYNSMAAAAAQNSAIGTDQAQSEI